MSRTQYESKEDLARENELADLISMRWNCKLHKLPLQYHLDFAAERDGEIVAFMEFKCRTFEMDKFPTFMISMSKMMTARLLFGVSGKDTYLIVKWTDKIARCDIIHCKYDVAMGGRRDRGDWQDVDPCCYIPLSEFTIIGDTGS
jgi:hypothetical protein|tara:strand:+ start:66 stop:500 length:435 start_codon:yes stop_codon:yes gene_type:complete